MNITRKGIESALENYRLGRLDNFSVPNQGLLNKVVFLKTTRGRYALKIALVNENTLDYVLGLLDQIRMKTTPRLISTIDDKLYFLYSGHKAFIYRYIPGNIPKRLSNRMTDGIGRFLAEYHKRSCHFPKNSGREEILGLSQYSIKEAIAQARRGRGKKGREALRHIETAIGKYRLPDNLPSGPIHVDVKPDNSLFIGDKLQGVVDFDNAYHGPLILDLAVAMSWYGIANGRVDPAKIKSLYSAYSKKRELIYSEKKSLFDAFHLAVLRNALRALAFLAQGRLPQKWVYSYLDDYLEAERNFVATREEFIKYLEN
jgi:homoserine kinase type II